MVLTAPSDWNFNKINEQGLKSTGTGMATGLGKAGSRALSSDD